MLNNNPPLIFEDGKQKRDFIHVKDVARPRKLAMENPAAAGEVFNIGSGKQYTISHIANKLATVMDKNIGPELTGKYRVGDIRHCFAGITKTKTLLGLE